MNYSIIVFSGLPRTGKSTLAEALGRHFSIPVFAKDWLARVELGRCGERQGVLCSVDRDQLIVDMTKPIDMNLARAIAYCE